MTQGLGNITRGAGSILDMAGSRCSRFLYIQMPEQSDAEALGEDWLQVGMDLYYGVRIVGEQLQHHVQAKE